MTRRNRIARLRCRGVRLKRVRDSIPHMIEQNAIAGIVGWSETLNELAIGLIFGTIAIVAATLIRRPCTLKSRVSFLMLIPAWLSLLASVMYGLNTPSQYRAYVLSGKPDDGWLRNFLEFQCSNQELWFEVALFAFAAWFVWVLLSWVFSKE